MIDCSLCNLGINHSCFNDEITMFDEINIEDEFYLHDKYNHGIKNNSIMECQFEIPVTTELNDVSLYCLNPSDENPVEIEPEELGKHKMTTYWQNNNGSFIDYLGRKCRYGYNPSGGCHRHCQYHCFCDDDIKCKKCLNAMVNFDTSAWSRYTQIKNRKNMNTNKLRAVVRKITKENVIKVKGEHSNYYYYKDTFFDITLEDILNEYARMNDETPQSHCEEASFVKGTYRTQSSYKHVKTGIYDVNPYYDRNNMKELPICLKLFRNQRENYSNRCNEKFKIIQNNFKRNKFH